MVLLLQLGDQRRECGRAGSLREPLPDPALHDRLDFRKPLRGDSQSFEVFQVFGDVHRGGLGIRRLGHHLEVLGRKLVHHDAAVLSVGDLCHELRHGPSGQLRAGETPCLVAGLHLGDQLGVASLRLDDGGDAEALAEGVLRHQPVGQVRPTDRAAVVGALDGVLLHQDPAIAALEESPHELVADVGVVGQSHLGGGESPDPPQGLEPEDGGEVMLPSPHVQAVVLHGSGGRDGVAPRRSQPFDMPTADGIAGEVAEAVEDVVQAHLPEAMEQAARILEHDPRALAAPDQLGDELAHPLVAPVEDRGVVIVADLRMIHHVFEIADDGRPAQILAPGWNQGLVHVQRTREEAPGPLEVDPALGQIDGTRSGDRLGDERLRAAEVGEIAEGFGKRLRTHRFGWAEVRESRGRRRHFRSPVPCGAD